MEKREREGKTTHSISSDRVGRAKGDTEHVLPEYLKIKNDGRIFQSEDSYIKW